MLSSAHSQMQLLAEVNIRGLNTERAVFEYTSG